MLSTPEPAITHPRAEAGDGRDEYGARRVWFAYGNQLAIGCGPFDLDTLELEENPLTFHFGLLQKLKHHILDA